MPPIILLDVSVIPSAFDAVDDCFYDMHNTAHRNDPDASAYPPERQSQAIHI